MSTKYWENLKLQRILKIKKRKEFRRVNKIFHANYFSNKKSEVNNELN